MGDWADDEAERFLGAHGAHVRIVEYVDSVSCIASALRAAEKRGMERAAEIIDAECDKWLPYYTKLGKASLVEAVMKACVAAILARAEELERETNG